MQSFAGLATEQWPDALEALADIRHDLGKYIGFEVRFLGPDPSVEELRMALKSDLLGTRKRGTEVESAWGLWARLRPDFLRDEPEVGEIDTLLEALEKTDLESGMEELQTAAVLATQVAHATRRLHKRALVWVEQQSNCTTE